MTLSQKKTLEKIQGEIDRLKAELEEVQTTLRTNFSEVMKREQELTLQDEANRAKLKEMCVALAKTFVKAPRNFVEQGNWGSGGISDEVRDIYLKTNVGVTEDDLENIEKRLESVFCEMRTEMDRAYLKKMEQINKEKRRLHSPLYNDLIDRRDDLMRRIDRLRTDHANLSEVGLFRAWAKAEAERDHAIVKAKMDEERKSRQAFRVDNVVTAMTDKMRREAERLLAESGWTKRKVF